ncbi:MAG: hypothetical protein HZA51_10115 [Planctomycetes bacterium]|nr:hypothetical protein [Planctomycetota bacterium]
MKTSVIKADNVQVPSRGLYSLDLRDIARKAESILDAARAEAARLVEESRADTARNVARVLEEAKARGFAEGLAQGREAGRVEALNEARARFAEEHGALATALTTLLADVESSRQRLYLEARRDVIVLATVIASRFLTSMAADEKGATEMATSACAEALETISVASDVVIRANPEDIVALERLCNELSATVQNSRHIRITPDPTVTRGGVVVESADAQVDATVEERIRRITEELAGVWKERAARLSM